MHSDTSELIATTERGRGRLAYSRYNILSSTAAVVVPIYVAIVAYVSPFGRDAHFSGAILGVAFMVAHVCGIWDHFRQRGSWYASARGIERRIGDVTSLVLPWHDIGYVRANSQGLRISAASGTIHICAPYVASIESEQALTMKLHAANSDVDIVYLGPPDVSMDNRLRIVYTAALAVVTTHAVVFPTTVAVVSALVTLVMLLLCSIIWRIVTA